MKYHTIEQLSELRLSAMRNEYQRQCELPSCQALSFDERFAQIVTAQANSRHESRLKRLVKSANLSDPTAILADIDKLKRKGYKMLDIVKLYASQGKLADDIDLTLLNIGKNKKR